MSNTRRLIRPIQEWVTLPDACTITAFSRSTLERAMHAGELKAVKPRGQGHWRIKLSDLNAWMESRNGY